MRLRSLLVRRLPGIDRDFELTGIAPGVNVVVGPNASGKSSVLRAVRALLYAEELKGVPVDIEGVFEDAAGELRATRSGGAIAWTRNGRPVSRPALPAHHLLGCYTLRIEDLSGVDGTDAEVAHRVGLELLGGYDLDKVRRDGPFRVKGSGRSQAERLRRAEERLRDVLNGRDQLLSDQARIDGWRRELQNAMAAADEAAAHERALALLEARREIRELEARLGEFPAGMERLTGNEAERLDALHDRFEEQAAALAAATETRTQAQRALAATGLEQSTLSPTDLAERRALLQETFRLEADAAALQEQATVSAAAVRRAEAEIGAVAPDGARLAPGAGRPPPTVAAGASRLERAAARPRLDPDTLRVVDDALTEKRKLTARRRQLEHELDTLAVDENNTESVDALREGRRALLAFLSAPGQRALTVPGVLGPLLVAAGVAGTAVLARLGGASWLPLALAGVAALLGLALLVRAGAGQRARREAAQRFQESGLSPMAAWEVQAVTARLESLDADIVRATARDAALARRGAATHELDRVREDLEAEDARLRTVADAVGFDPAHLDADFQRWLRLVDAVDSARSGLEAATAKLSAKREDIASRRDALAQFLLTHGEAPGTVEPGAMVLQERLEALATRVTERDAAHGALDASDAALELATRERARLSDEARSLLTEAGLEPGEGDPGSRAAERALRERLERLDDFRKTQSELRDAKARRDDRARMLGTRRALLAAVEADDEDGLRTAKKALEETAAQRDRIQSDITRTVTLIDRAHKERALERAHTERRAAIEALADVVLANLRAEAGLCLLDAVEADYEKRSQPSTLRRAKEWFGRFTLNEFKLDYDAGLEPPFLAVDNSSGEVRTPAELSTGTRAQFLLAIRVAFAIEAEAGTEALPLFLDEALTTADAERFGAVAASLGLLAGEAGRQLFYLTARAEDASLWGTQGSGARSGAPNVIDIAKVRRRDRTVPSPELLSVAPGRTVSAPDGFSPEHYAVEVGVGAIDPWEAPTACHLFHLLRDDLPLLHRLLLLGIERVGQAQALLSDPAGQTRLSSAEMALLGRRAAGVNAFLEGWRRGRNRPLDRQALIDSDAVNPTFLDRVDAVSLAVDRDPQALLTALERGDVPRFRTRNREQLATWLADAGYLDERPVLDPVALELRVQQAMAAGDAVPANSGTLAAREADDGLLVEAERLTTWLEAGIRAGGGKPDGS